MKKLSSEANKDKQVITHTGGTEVPISGIVANHCINHPTNVMEYICETEKLGFCSECLFKHYQLGHEIISIETSEQDIWELLMNMEKDCLDILQQKNKMLVSCEEHLAALMSDKQ